jgi:hypothetical protein
MATNFTEPAKLATDCGQGIVVQNPESTLLFVSSVAHFVGFGRALAVTPGSASPSPGATTLSACFAGSLNDSTSMRTQV